MKKKVIIAASILGVLTLGVGAFVFARTTNTSVTADEPDLLTEMKIGKYYLVGGTEDEYIEVFDDNTLQMFGFDYFVDGILSNPANNFILSLDEAEYAEMVAAHQEQTDFWKSRNYYWLSDYSRVIFLDTEPHEPGQEFTGSLILSYIDENTIEYSDDRIYKYAG